MLLDACVRAAHASNWMHFPWWPLRARDAPSLEAEPRYAGEWRPMWRMPWLDHHDDDGDECKNQHGQPVECWQRADLACPSISVHCIGCWAKKVELRYVEIGRRLETLLKETPGIPPTLVAAAVSPASLGLGDGHVQLLFDATLTEVTEDQESELAKLFNVEITSEGATNSLAVPKLTVLGKEVRLYLDPEVSLDGAKVAVTYAPPEDPQGTRKTILPDLERTSAVKKGLETVKGYFKKKKKKASVDDNEEGVRRFATRGAKGAHLPDVVNEVMARELPALVVLKGTNKLGDVVHVPPSPASRSRPF